MLQCMPCMCWFPDEGIKRWRKPKRAPEFDFGPKVVTPGYIEGAQSKIALGEEITFAAADGRLLKVAKLKILSLSMSKSPVPPRSLPGRNSAVVLRHKYLLRTAILLVARWLRNFYHLTGISCGSPPQVVPLTSPSDERKMNHVPSR